MNCNLCKEETGPFLDMGIIDGKKYIICRECLKKINIPDVLQKFDNFIKKQQMKKDFEIKKYKMIYELKKDRYMTQDEEKTIKLAYNLCETFETAGSLDKDKNLEFLIDIAKNFIKQRILVKKEQKFIKKNTYCTCKV